MKLISSVLGLLIAVVVVGTAPAGAQDRGVYFSHNATTSKCSRLMPIYAVRVNFDMGGFVNLLPNQPGEVIENETAVSLYYKAGTYFPASNAKINPGAICFFDKCQNHPGGSILLTCGGMWPDQHVLFVWPAKRRFTPRR